VISLVCTSLEVTLGKSFIIYSNLVGPINILMGYRGGNILGSNNSVTYTKTTNGVNIFCDGNILTETSQGFVANHDNVKGKGDSAKR